MNENKDELENKQDQVYELAMLDLDALLSNVEIDSELRIAVHRT